MSEPIAYRSHVRIERVKGPLRRAYLPAESEPVLFGVHSEIAQHYGVDPESKRIGIPHSEGTKTSRFKTQRKDRP